ncbi:hypothetical protein Fmac_013246 [Flemingia macrophylla]|uniref:Ubiquinone biosynthesis protein n=1 Tax=Flemingia macrophylla TaxID=520843 RepID=A0ABD1MSM3_9FABA
MYRTAAKRLFRCATYYHGSNAAVRFPPPLHMLVPSSRFSTSENQPPADRHSTIETPNLSSSSSSSSSTNEDAGPKYEDQLALVLQASLRHVEKETNEQNAKKKKMPLPHGGPRRWVNKATLASSPTVALLTRGWSEFALIAGARDVGLSPSIIGSFSRKEAALVEYFMDDCLQRLVDKVDSDESLKNLTPSECITKLIRFRLEMQAPYISTWPEALGIQAQPVNVSTSFKQRALLVDEMSHAAGDSASDIDWYAKRTILGGIYSTTEIYMLTDKSPGTVFGRSSRCRAGRSCWESFPEMSRGGKKDMPFGRLRSLTAVAPNSIQFYFYE